MPTAEAHFLLGMLDKQAGRSDDALKHFQTAAQSDSSAGQNARVEMVRLDAPQNPSRYVATQAAVDEANEVWALIGNRTSVPLRDIEVSYAWLDSQDQARFGKVSYPGPLAGGEQDRLKLGIRLDNPRKLDQRVRVEITAARIAE